MYSLRELAKCLSEVTPVLAKCLSKVTPVLAKCLSKVTPVLAKCLSKVTPVPDTLFIYSLNLLAVTSEFNVVAVFVADVQRGVLEACL